MLETLLILAIGIVIGWNIPQPLWARDLQEQAVSSIKAMIDKIRGA